MQSSWNMDEDNEEGKSKSVREFEVPLGLSSASSKTHDCFVIMFDQGTPEECWDVRRRWKVLWPS